MSDHPYIVSKKTQSNYQVVNSITGKVYTTCTTEDIALTIIHVMEAARREGNDAGFEAGFEDGFHAGTRRALSLNNAFAESIKAEVLPKGEQDAARPVEGQRQNAKRVADRDRKRAGEGGAA